MLFDSEQKNTHQQKQEVMRLNVLRIIFENQYWITGTGAIVRAVQWISEPAGYVEYERLID